MAAKAGVLGYYGCIALVYCFSLWYNIQYITVGRHGHSTIWTYDGYGGKFKYLTFLNMVLQTVYFGLCLLNCFAGSSFGASLPKRRCSALQRLRDNFHATLAFPVGMFVVTTFWAIYAVDRELVYPKDLDSIIPSWMNHAMHTTVLPFLLVEKNLVYHHHPKRHNGIFILSAFALAYLLWILWIAYSADLWVYPILRIMSGSERAIFIMFLLMFFISIYLVGEALTNFIWRREKAEALVAVKQK